MKYWWGLFTKSLGMVFGVLGAIAVLFPLADISDNNIFERIKILAIILTIVIIISIIGYVIYTKRKSRCVYNVGSTKIFFDYGDFNQLIKDDKIQSEMYSIKVGTDITIVIMKKRDMNNIVLILKKYSKQFSLEEEINAVGERVQEYATIIGNHQDDLDFLQKGLPELQRPLNLIDSKLSEAMLKLFD